METLEMLIVSIVLPRYTFMDTRAHVLLATQELTFRFGIRSVSMDDIAKHLGISKKTIYQFFSDKNEIIHSLMQFKLQEDEKALKEIEKNSANVVEEVFNLMKHIGNAIGQANPNLFYDLQKYYPETWKLFTDFKVNCILKMVEETLARGIKQGLIRTDINLKILSRMRMEQVEMGFNPAVFSPDKFKILDVQLSLLDHFLYGICTLKGHKLINKYKQIIDEE
ncbi:MAG: TetR/AcrR family transcriptional regulator [Bacteroidetes bacterium]|nr:MAG: TetR/AcrR family transcriptional regulator [Bacteroidota bacterium]